MDTKTRVTKFGVVKERKRPKQINESGSVFALFIPQRVKVLPGETKKSSKETNKLRRLFTKRHLKLWFFTVFGKRKFNNEILSIP